MYVFKHLLNVARNKYFVNNKARILLTISFTIILVSTIYMTTGIALLEKRLIKDYIEASITGNARTYSAPLYAAEWDVLKYQEYGIITHEKFIQYITEIEELLKNKYNGYFKLEYSTSFQSCTALYHNNKKIELLNEIKKIYYVWAVDNDTFTRYTQESSKPEGILLSTTIAQKYDIKQNDTIIVKFYPMGGIKAYNVSVKVIELWNNTIDSLVGVMPFWPVVTSETFDAITADILRFSVAFATQEIVEHYTLEGLKKVIDELTADINNYWLKNGVTNFDDVSLINYLLFSQHTEDMIKFMTVNFWSMTVTFGAVFLALPTLTRAILLSQRRRFGVLRSRGASYSQIFRAFRDVVLIFFAVSQVVNLILTVVFYYAFHLSVQYIIYNLLFFVFFALCYIIDFIVSLHRYLKNFYFEAIRTHSFSFAQKRHFRIRDIVLLVLTVLYSIYLWLTTPHVYQLGLSSPGNAWLIRGGYMVGFVLFVLPSIIVILRRAPMVITNFDSKDRYSSNFLLSSLLERRMAPYLRYISYALFVISFGIISFAASRKDLYSHATAELANAKVQPYVFTYLGSIFYFNLLVTFCIFIVYLSTVFVILFLELLPAFRTFLSRGMDLHTLQRGVIRYFLVFLVFPEFLALILFYAVIRPIILSFGVWGVSPPIPFEGFYAWFILLLVTIIVLLLFVHYSAKRVFLSEKFYAYSEVISYG